MSRILPKDVRCLLPVAESGIPETGVASCGATDPSRPLAGHPTPPPAPDPSPAAQAAATPTPSSLARRRARIAQAASTETGQGGGGLEQPRAAAGAGRAEGPGAGENAGGGQEKSSSPSPSPRPEIPRVPVPGIYRIPLRTGRGLNTREHHMVRARRVANERWVVGMVLNPKPRPTVPCAVMLTRVSPASRPLDSDNLQGSLKAVRDEVARWLGVDDADARVTWAYEQRQGAWGVVVEVRDAEG